MAKTSLNIAVIILNWNRADDTIECLKSVKKLDKAGIKLLEVVVDNASSDESLDKIKNFDPKLKIIRNSKNLGYAGGNNVGLRYAIKNGVDYILVVNNDTILDKRLLQEFKREAKGNPKAGILSPKIYFAPGYEFHKNRYKKKDLGRVIWYAGGKIDWKNVYGTNFGVDEVDRGQFGKVREIDFATGTCMFLKKEALLHTGLFDEKYFMYLEDVDLSVRMKAKGWQIIYVPEAFLWHKVAQSSGIGSNLTDYYITRNRMLFGLRYAPMRSYLALIRESVKFLAVGRKWQRLGILSYYLRNFGKGGWSDAKNKRNYNN